MILVRSIVVVCCASVCLCGREVSSAEDDQDLQVSPVEDGRRFGVGLESSGNVEKHLTDEVEKPIGLRETFKGKGRKVPIVFGKSFQTETSRVVRPVAFSYSNLLLPTQDGKQHNTTNQAISARALPRIKSVHHPNYRAPLTASTLAPTYLHTRLSPKYNLKTSEEEEKQLINESVVNKPFYKAKNVTNQWIKDSENRPTYKVSQNVNVYDKPTQRVVDDKDVYERATDKATENEDADERQFSSHEVAEENYEDKRQTQRVFEDEAPSSREVEDEDEDEKQPYRVIKNKDDYEKLEGEEEEEAEDWPNYESEDEDDEWNGYESEEVGQHRELLRSASEEDNYSSQGDEEDRSDDYHRSSDDYRNNGDQIVAVEKMKPNLKMDVDQFIKKHKFPTTYIEPQYVNDSLRSINDSSSRIKKPFLVEQKSQLVQRSISEDHLKAGSIDKILQEPLKFAYSEALRPSESKPKKYQEKKIEKKEAEESHSEQYSSDGNKSDKGYKSFKRNKQGNKGHHEEEAKENMHSEQKGKKNTHDNAEDYFKVKKHKKKGKKGVTYEDEGSYKKGYSTKGEHNIHKKNEFLKKQEFYDEHHESGEKDQHSGYHENQGRNYGGMFTIGHKKTAYDGDHHGRQIHHEKGGHHKEKEGYKKITGSKEHHENKEEHDKEHDYNEEKKWSFNDNNYE